MINDNATAEILEGIGEFELRDVYVKAEVKIQNGVVCDISFSTAEGNKIPGSQAIVSMLVEQPLSRALEAKGEQVESIEGSQKEIIKVAMFEAFHRAVEGCLDNE